MTDQGEEARNIGGADQGGDGAFQEPTGTNLRKELETANKKAQDAEIAFLEAEDARAAAEAARQVEVEAIHFKHLINEGLEEKK